MAQNAIAGADVEMSAADKLLAQLLQTPFGQKHYPLSAGVLQARVDAVKADAMENVDALTPGADVQAASPQPLPPHHRQGDDTGAYRVFQRHRHSKGLQRQQLLRTCHAASCS